MRPANVFDNFSLCVVYWIISINLLYLQSVAYNISLIFWTLNPLNVLALLCTLTCDQKIFIGVVRCNLKNFEFVWQKIDIKNTSFYQNFFLKIVFVGTPSPKNLAISEFPYIDINTCKNPFLFLNYFTFPLWKNTNANCHHCPHKW